MVDWRKLAFQMLCRFINHGTLIKLLKRIGGNGKRKLVYEEFNQAFVLLVIPFLYFFFLRSGAEMKNGLKLHFL